MCPKYLAYTEMTKETKEVAELDKEIREMELELARLRSKYPLEDVSISVNQRMGAPVN